MPERAVFFRNWRRLVDCWPADGSAAGDLSGDDGCPEVDVGVICSMWCFLRSTIHVGGGGFDGFADARVGAAAADISLHGHIDIFVGGMGIFFEQGGGGEDLSALAVAALRHLFSNPCLLHRMGVVGG